MRRRVALNPLTERILSQMGLEGSAIRQRLQRFYHGQNLQNQDRPPQAPAVRRTKVDEKPGWG
jgi:hypothetical protein